MSPRKTHQEERSLAPAWSPETETREDVKALLGRRSRLTPSEIVTFRALYPALYDTFIDTLRCVVRARGVTRAVESELVHEAFTDLWDESVAGGLPESIQAKLVSLASGLANNQRRRDRRDPATEPLPTSSTDVPGSFPKREHDYDLKETARALFDTLSDPHKEVIGAVILRDVTVTQFALDVGIDRTTASSRLTAALTLLRETAEAIYTASERRL